MNKAFVLHYTCDNKEHKLFSNLPSVLLNKVRDWEEDGMSTEFDHLEEIQYKHVGELLEKINTILEQ